MDTNDLLNYTPGAVKAVNQKVNELLLKHEDTAKDVAVDPSVDIMKIAKACGINEVILVPPSQLGGKHAVVENGVVKIDENDAEGQRLFDLAHEVGHIVFNQITHMDIVVKFENTSYILQSTKYKAARHGTKRKSELPPGEREIEDFIDHFAANLLIPINRFQLWEDKTDKEIAEAFKVEEKCIKKRRQEVVYEVSILTSEMKPCSAETISDPNVNLNIENILKDIDS